MRYRLLGNLAVERDDGAPVSIPAPKRRALLAILLLQRGRAIPRERLMDELWREEPPDAAQSSLFAHVSRLRGELGGAAIRTEPGGYRLPLDDAELDVIDFERDVARARAALAARSWAAAEAAFNAALARWRGAALADFADEPFAQAEIARLDETRTAALEGAATARLELGRHADLIPDLERLAAEHPLRESLWGLLMLALYRSSRQADALARYRQLRRTLHDELGLDPAPELQELQLRILRQDPGLGRGAAERLPVRLPAFPTLIGRAAELERARRGITEHRMLTLVGPGGIGKTSLAVLVAQSMLDEHPDGTQFVDLSAVTDPGRVIERIGDAVGGGGRPELAIGQRHMLVVLDNFEQVIDAASDVSRLLRACPNLRVIVTSRAPLRLAGERLLELPPLQSDAAAALFVDRTTAALGDSALARDVIEAVVASLEGLPLALELAAARTRALALEAVRDRLADPLALLTDGRRDAPLRHRSLRDTIDWSYRLLSEESRRVFRSLSVLASGFDLEAALAVGQGDVDAIAELVDQSLLRRVGDRYGMLETIRQFAAEAAASNAEDREARARHARHFVPIPLAARTRVHATPEDGPGLRGHAWLEACTRELENLRLAFAWSEAQGDADALVELFRGMGMYWVLVGAAEEGMRWVDAVLPFAASRPTAQHLQLLAVSAEINRFQGSFERAVELERALIAGATDFGDPDWVATASDDMAWTLGALDRYDEAWAAIAVARQIHAAEAACEPNHLAHTLYTSAELLLRQGRSAEAAQMLADYRAAETPSLDTPEWTVQTNLLEGLVRACVGDSAAARPILLDVIDTTSRLGFRFLLAEALDALASILVTDEPAAAARALGMADRARAESRSVAWLVRRRAETIERGERLAGPAWLAALAEGGAVAVPSMGAEARRLGLAEPTPVL